MQRLTRGLPLSALVMAILLSRPSFGTHVGLKEEADHIAASTARYVVLIKKRPFRYEIRRGGKVVLAAPRKVGGFLAVDSEEIPFTDLVSYGLKGEEVWLRVSTRGGNIVVNYNLHLAPDRIEVQAQVEGPPRLARVGERFSLASGGHWFGGAVTAAHLWPLEQHEWNADPFLATSNHATPFWMTSSGVGIYLDTYDDITAAINKNNDGLFRFAYLRAQKMHYTIFVGTNISEVRDLFVSSVGKPRRRPPDVVFERPVWSTWIPYLNGVTQRDVIDLARRIHHEGWPASVIEIDEGWQTGYCDLQFNSKFPDPKALVEEIHRLGYLVTLWVCNFANPGARCYEQALLKGHLIRDAATGGPAIVRWWVGEGALIDFSHPGARGEYKDGLRKLMQAYGIDGFKIDGGDAEYWPGAGALAAQPTVTRNRYTDLWAELGAEFELNELRVGWLSQPLGLFNRLRDKSATWSESDGLPAIVTHGSMQSLLGFVFNCPDLIGGGLDSAFKPDEELNVRWAQAAAFMPIVQFSFPPWNYTEASQRIIRQCAELHAELWRSRLKPLADRAMQTGRPIWSPLFYIFPEDEKAFFIDDQFMVGDNLLVAPVLKPALRRRPVYLPAGDWRDFWTGSIIKGGGPVATVPAPLERIPVFERVGR